MIPIHTSSPKVYVTCRNVEVQTEEIRNDIVHEAEVIHDGNIFLKVFHNADTGIDEPPNDHYGDEQFWLNRHAQQTYFLNDDDDDDDNDVYGNIYQRNRAGAPQSVVWRNCVNAANINFDTVYANAVSGLYACDIAIQTEPEQIGDDTFYTDGDVFSEIVDNVIFTDDDDGALFTGDVVEWEN